MTLLETTMTYSERVSLAGQVTLIGLATLFAVLAILMLALYLFQYFSYTLPQKKKNKALTSAPVETIQVEEEPVQTTTDDTQLIAVLAAAIAAYESTVNQNTSSFHVVSYKRRSSKTSWNGDNGIDD